MSNGLKKQAITRAITRTLNIHIKRSFNWRYLLTVSFLLETTRFRLDFCCHQNFPEACSKIRTVTLDIL